MARILSVGNATLDLIHTVERYPGEDEEVRALLRERRRGGNAANTAVVLSQLGHACAWAGVRATASEADFILDDLHRHGVDTRHVCAKPGQTPMSFIILSRATGSRTIVHYRDLVEYSFDDFRAVDPAQYDWFHFEARNVAETRAMVARLRDSVPAVRISIEVEKDRADIETLYPFADVLLFSAAFATQRGLDARALLASARTLAPAADLYCGRGAQGASALDTADRYHESPAFAPPEVVDTLGAGDTFNAAIVDGYFRVTLPAERLARACRFAGEKCGRRGLDGMGNGLG